jgi:hypothetical protein
MQCSAMPDNAFSTWMMAQAFVLIQPVWLMHGEITMYLTLSQPAKKQE